MDFQEWELKWTALPRLQDIYAKSCGTICQRKLVREECCYASQIFNCWRSWEHPLLRGNLKLIPTWENTKYEREISRLSVCLLPQSLNSVISFYIHSLILLVLNKDSTFAGRDLQEDVRKLHEKIHNFLWTYLAQWNSYKIPEGIVCKLCTHTLVCTAEF